jgi:hypothetical protein
VRVSDEVAFGVQFGGWVGGSRVCRMVGLGQMGALWDGGRFEGSG